MPPKKFIETGLTSKTVDEGIAHWGTFEALLIENGRNIDDPTLSFRAHQAIIVGNKAS